MRRQVRDAEAARLFFDAQSAQADDPLKLTGMGTAVDRLRHAIRTGEHIVVYGDYDTDGVTATALLVQVLTAPIAIQILAQLYPCKDSSTTAANAGVPKTGEDTAPVGMETIDVMRTLQKTTGHENDDVLEKIRTHADAYPPPVLFGLARVLYRRGDVDEGIFWFNAGRLRGNFDAWRSTDVVSARATMVAMSREMPIELRKAQFADLQKLRGIVTKVIAWDETTPRNYDRRWIDFHGVAANKSGPGTGKPPVSPGTIAPEKWDELAKQVREEYRKDLEVSIAMMSNAKK